MHADHPTTLLDAHEDLNASGLRLIPPPLHDLAGPWWVVRMDSGAPVASGADWQAALQNARTAEPFGEPT